ncbi:zonular occludens toxin domain-containing protein [Chitinimonas lacunae]|uniref:Zonular occludens toxin domain-containing protein n=1 Tax=Chitinimonas lacunae TaxID=1963018 RepID=A0ABV8MJZ5_9NEIS
MITLFTGIPGAGKTLFMLHHAKRRADAENRPVYYDGVNECALDWEMLDDPKEWFKLPVGSIIVIDECQRIFGRRKAGANVPDFISEFETHRHRGYDIYLTTQGIHLIDAHLKPLIGQHFHITRFFGGFNRAKAYEWPRIGDPAKPSELTAAQEHRWAYPKEVFNWYKSSELHTYKINIPKKFYILPAAVLGVIFLTYKADSILSKFGGAESENPENKKGSVISDNNILASSMSSSAPAQLMTREQYLASREPRIVGFPATAPAYDKITTPVSAPRPAACMATKTRCSCYTQQGTLMPDMPIGVCVQIAHNGYFDDTQRDPMPATAPSLPVRSEPGLPLIPAPPSIAQPPMTAASTSTATPSHNPALWW